MSLKEAKFIWYDGKFVNWEDANCHILTTSLHYANSVFEGIRAYITPKGLAVFRLEEHIKRLFNSAKACKLEIPYSYEEILKATKELLEKNKFEKGIYIRPLVFLGYKGMGVTMKGARVQVAIIAWELDTYMGKDALNEGIRVKISSWVKPPQNSLMAKAKNSANYFVSLMANNEALESGFDEALILDNQGFVSEGPGECLFIVRDGEILSPYNDTSLESLTQKTVISLAKDIGYEVKRVKLARDDLYFADEAFFTGTGAEVMPIIDIDGRKIGSGKLGEITKKIQNEYFKLVHGELEKYEKLLTYIKE